MSEDILAELHLHASSHSWLFIDEAAEPLAYESPLRNMLCRNRG